MGDCLTGESKGSRYRKRGLTAGALPADGLGGRFVDVALVWRGAGLIAQLVL
jgi:hypothetical protein